jgi:hypothetical protein
VSTDRFEYRVVRLTGRRYDSYYGDYGQEIRTDCQLYRVNRRTGERGAQRALSVQDHGGERVDLRAHVPPLSPGYPRVYWHRILAYLWDNPDKEPYSAFRDRDAGHARDEWWFVRAKGCHWLTPAENRGEQGARGLAGQPGARSRRRPPSWARADYSSDDSS